MAIELSIVQQRGTIFIPHFISYNQENANKFSDVLQGAKIAPVPFPSPFGGPMQVETLQEGGNWQLVRGSIRVIFYPNRIDIIKDWISPRHTKEEDEFLSLCSSVFSSILTRAKVTAARVAYAPLFARDKDSSFSDSMLWEAVFKDALFNNTQPNEVSVTRNYRIERSLGEKNVILNFRSTLGTANHTLPDGTIATGSVLVNFDINTVPEIDYQLDQGILRVFFNEVLGYSDEMYNNFIGE